MKSKKLWYKKFDHMVDWLWKNRSHVIEKYDWGKDFDKGFIEIEFDYPDYCGLPKKISYNLTGDFVDIVQECITEMIQSKTKLKMKKTLKDCIRQREGYDI